MIARVRDATTALELFLRPRLEQVWAVRQLVETHYQPILRDAALLDRLGLTAHELLENAAKYGADGLSSLQVAVVGAAAGTELQIAVSNPINQGKVADLRRVWDQMSQAGDPLAFYQQRMKHAAKRDDGGSGLGLARISFEAEMALSMHLDDEHVRILAVAPISLPETTT